ncbi:hypothetical protein [Geomesophilobacter sediminis]|uniref:Uncharacterized protein n=1 Tax=Geomesophilobacter sediminis TaxID=2798584 RepID=A0A8J7J658_9BACT|nr:hypothetical protein [Geomesophilobacter sediminis]MBJ6724151.1 hypothetical protein [Geomesophilobacter sediminis]
MTKFTEIVLKLMWLLGVCVTAVLALPLLVTAFPFLLAGEKRGAHAFSASMPHHAYLVPVGFCAFFAMIFGALYTASPVFANVVNGLGVAIGALPAAWF